jgi:glycosyltransferase involved in cell wall biosynthesis
VTAPTTCTIIARNYLAHARALARSFSAHHPGERLQVLVIDDLQSATGTPEEPFDVISPLELPIEVRILHEMATCYDVMELSTALKPWLMRLLLSRTGGRPVVYLDPDILVFAPLDEVTTIVDQHPIVLTPHTVTPMPRDGLKPTETEIMASGVYNLGFLALGAGSGPFLEWWQERLRIDAIVDHAAMLFTDQRWIDLAVSYFPAHLLRDPGYNVAYWNADQRSVESREGDYLACGQPLRFFHFSGFDPHKPYLLSKHQGDQPRVLLSQYPAVAELCADYAARLLAEGYDECRKHPYGWGKLADGTVLDQLIRRAYRQGVVEADRYGDPPPPDGFDAGTIDQLYDWLSRPGRRRLRAPRMPRYLWEIYAERSDVQREYPRPGSVDEAAFKGWLRHFGVKEVPVPERLVPLMLGEVPWGAPVLEPAPADRLRPGYLVTGYLRAELGLGEAARLAMQAIAKAGITSASFTYNLTASRQDHPWEHEDVAAPDLDTNIVWVNPDQLAEFAQTVGPAYYEGRYTVGNWAWETERLPGWMAETSDLVDEIWTPSEYSRAAVMASVVDKPVYTFPHPILVPVVDPNLDRAALGLPDKFVFLFIYDFLSTAARKNPLGLIQAFKRAFAPGEGPVLVLKSINAPLRLLAMDRLKLEAEGRPDIVFADRYATRAELSSLLAASDCYVSLHRAEGFGLTIADAMALGKPVVATGYSGNLEFMDETTSYLVPYTLTAVGEGAGQYEPDSRWADPDLDAAAGSLRRVFEDQEEAGEKGAAAREAVLRDHGLERAARFVAGRFDAIQEMRRTGHHSPVADAVRRRLA